MSQIPPRIQYRPAKESPKYYVTINYGMFDSFSAANEFRKAMHTDPDLPDNVILYSEVKGSDLQWDCTEAREEDRQRRNK